MASERVTGTLKYFGPTKDGDKATLTGKWDNGKEKMWCTWEESKGLRDAKLAYEHPVDKWDDGAPKWCVNGQPEITLDVTWKDKVATTKVTIAGNEAAEPALASDPKATDLEKLAQIAEQYATAHALAVLEQMKNFDCMPSDQAAIQAGAATVFIAMKDAGIRVKKGQAAGIRKAIREAEEKIDSSGTGTLS